MMKISKIKKLCVVTGSRAEYGLLKNLFFLIKEKNLDYANCNRVTLIGYMV